MHPESRLNQYVHNAPQADSGGGVPWATAGEGGILRDNPFGASPVGGETPFFTGPSDAGGSFEDDTEGIPLGLPGLLDLPDVPEVTAIPAAPVAEAVAELDVTLERTPRISRDPALDIRQVQQAFAAGLVVASVAWLLVIGGWMFVTFS